MDGGEDGSSGIIKSLIRGTIGVGQGYTTREFGESTGTLYAGGGGGGAGCEQTGRESSTYGSGGAGGGGAGGGSTGGSCASMSTTTLKGKNGSANTGGGGGGGAYNNSAGNGGSGIIVIRNARNIGNNIPSVDFNFTYTNINASNPAYYAISNDGNGNWRIKFLTDGIFRVSENIDIDVFLVGGGGGGGYRSGRYGGGGGGGGYNGPCR